MGKAIDEKKLEIQEIEKLKIDLSLANTEIKKLKKDIEMLKKAIKIDVKNININPNKVNNEISISLDTDKGIDIKFSDDSKVVEELTLSGQELLSENTSKAIKEDIQEKEESKSILEFVVEEDSIDELEKDEVCIEIKEQEESIDLEHKETKEKTKGISIEEIDEEVQLGLEKISEEIELGFKNIADQTTLEEEIALAVVELKEEEKEAQHIDLHSIENKECKEYGKESETLITIEEKAEDIKAKEEEVKKQEIIDEDEILEASEAVMAESNESQKDDDIISNVEHIIESIENNIKEDNNSENKGLLGKIKKSFIENNNYECIITLNKIIDEINEIEKELIKEEKIVLLYLSFFYDKLNDLLEKSKVINEFYISENEECKLLKMIIDEKEFDLNKEVYSSVNNILKNNKNIFSSLETIIKVNIIEKINHIIYKNFDEVFSINNIVYGEDTVSIRAWVKKKEEVKWKLVEGLYSSDNNKLYMLESAISILKLNYHNNSNDVVEEDSNIWTKEVYKKKINSKVNNLESDKEPIKKQDINNTSRIEKDNTIKANTEIKNEDIYNNDSKHGLGKLKNIFLRRNKKNNK